MASLILQWEAAARIGGTQVSVDGSAVRVARPHSFAWMVRPTLFSGHSHRPEPTADRICPQRCLPASPSQRLLPTSRPGSRKLPLPLFHLLQLPLGWPAMPGLCVMQVLTTCRVIQGGQFCHLLSKRKKLFSWVASSSVNWVRISEFPKQLEF